MPSGCLLSLRQQRLVTVRCKRIKQKIPPLWICGVFPLISVTVRKFLFHNATVVHALRTFFVQRRYISTTFSINKQWNWLIFVCRFISFLLEIFYSNWMISSTKHLFWKDKYFLILDIVSGVVSHSHSGTSSRALIDANKPKTRMMAIFWSIFNYKKEKMQTFNTKIFIYQRP